MEEKSPQNSSSCLICTEGTLGPKREDGSYICNNCSALHVVDEDGHIEIKEG
jgi:hypothetical protein